MGGFMKLVLATQNAGKIREIKAKLKPLGGIEVLSAAEVPDLPDVVEDGATFRENALKKSRAIAAHTGLPALADDSGLEVDALNGEPGVYSARYAGEGASDRDRNLLVLDRMRDVPDEKRAARFRCVIAITLPSGEEHVADGVCEGIIARSLSGDGGFGYDPIFFLPEFGKTMAEISVEEKNRISHRGRALDRAAEIIAGLRREA